MDEILNHFETMVEHGWYLHGNRIRNQGFWCRWCEWILISPPSTVFPRNKCPSEKPQDQNSLPKRVPALQASWEGLKQKFGKALLGPSHGQSLLVFTRESVGMNPGIPSKATRMVTPFLVRLLNAPARRGLGHFRSAQKTTSRPACLR